MPVLERPSASHPHINFRLDLRQIKAPTWVLLGESKSKAQHVGRALLSPKAAEELLQVYLVKGMLATTAIEGNTLSEDEVRRILDRTLELPPSREYLEKEIENVLSAYNTAKGELLEDPNLPFTVERLCGSAIARQRANTGFHAACPLRRRHASAFGHPVERGPQ